MRGRGQRTTADIEFLVDVRRHTNNRGERFEVLLFLGADSHIASFLKGGSEGVPDTDTEAHALRDIRALAAAFPNAWHGQHLIAASNSWSSSEGEGDDPNGGNKTRAWERCVAAGQRSAGASHPREGKVSALGGVDWCRQALAIGGWGCGSASYRRPRD